MSTKKLTVALLARQLSECNQEAEIKIVIGNIPQALPVEKLAIREDISGDELVTLVVAHETFLEVIDYGVEMLQNSADC